MKGLSKDANIDLYQVNKCKHVTAKVTRDRFDGVIVLMVCCFEGPIVSMTNL
jgi:hypothetical protein